MVLIRFLGGRRAHANESAMMATTTTTRAISLRRRELNLVWCLSASLSLSSYAYVRCAERLLAGKGSDWNIARRFEVGSIVTLRLARASPARYSLRDVEVTSRSRRERSLLRLFLLTCKWGDGARL